MGVEDSIESFKFSNQTSTKAVKSKYSKGSRKKSKGKNKYGDKTGGIFPEPSLPSLYEDEEYTQAQNPTQNSRYGESPIREEDD